MNASADRERKPPPTPDAGCGSSAPGNRPAGFALCLAVFLAAAALNLAWLGHAPLVDTTEARHAEVAREFAADGHWLVPTLNGWPHLTKPPLTDWLAAAGILIFGPSEFGARFANALAAALAVALTAALAGRLAGRRAALAAATVMTACPLHLVLSRSISIDVILAALSAGFYLMLWRLTRPECRRTWPGVLLLGILLGLGAMAKGHIALLILFAPALAWALTAGLPGVRGTPYRRRAAPVAVAALAVLAVAAAVALPWFLYIARTFPNWLGTIARQEFGGRLSGSEGESWPGTAIVYLLAGCLPALPLALAAVLACRRTRRSKAQGSSSKALPAGDQPLGSARGPEPVEGQPITGNPALEPCTLHLAPAPCLPPGACSLLLIWIALPLLVFGAVQGQRMNYVDPLVPAAAVLAGAGWCRLAGRWAAAGAFQRAMALATAALPVALGLAVTGLPVLLPTWGGMQPTLGQALWLVLAGALAALAGVLGLLALRRGRTVLAGGALAVAAFSIWALAPPATAVHHEFRSTRESCRFLRDRMAEGQRFAFYRDYVHSVGFYLGGKVPVIQPAGDTKTWAARWPDWTAPGGAGPTRSWKELAREISEGRTGVWLMAYPRRAAGLAKLAQDSRLELELHRLERDVVLAHVRAAREKP